MQFQWHEAQDTCFLPVSGMSAYSYNIGKTVGVDQNLSSLNGHFYGKNHFSPNFATSTQNSCGALCWTVLDCMWEYLVGSGSLTRDIWASEWPSKFILWRTELRAHLPPVSLETGHNKTSQQLLSFQEKAVFPQALSKLSPDFRRKIALRKLHLQKSMYVPVISYYFRKTFAKKTTVANSGFNFRQRSFWYTKGHRILHSRQGPLNRQSTCHAGSQGWCTVAVYSICMICISHAYRTIKNSEILAVAVRVGVFNDFDLLDVDDIWRHGIVTVWPLHVASNWCMSDIAVLIRSSPDSLQN